MVAALTVGVVMVTALVAVVMVDVVAAKLTAVVTVELHDASTTPDAGCKE